ncbi:MAG TPA: hypothetical protein PKY50_17395 [Candidatus Competibacter sp.]|nr:hypothetical protein [Candidatus Competibacter sp.]
MADNSNTQKLHAAITKAALKACDSSSLEGELHERLVMVTDALEHLEHIASAADFHRIDLSFRSLYGVLRLINREAQVIDAISSALCGYEDD